MQEFWEFDIDQPLDNPSDPSYAQIIRELVEQKARDMGIYLSYYYKGEGGLVEKVEWADGLHLENPLVGSFKVSYDIVYFNACLDINSASRNEMRISFVLDEARRKLKLNGPYWPERGLDEI